MGRSNQRRDFGLGQTFGKRGGLLRIIDPAAGIVFAHAFFDQPSHHLPQRAETARHRSGRQPALVPFAEQITKIVRRAAVEMNLRRRQRLKARAQVTAIGLKTVSRESAIRGHRLEKFSHEPVWP